MVYKKKLFKKINTNVCVFLNTNCSCMILVVNLIITVDVLSCTLKMYCTVCFTHIFSITRRLMIESVVFLSGR